MARMRREASGFAELRWGLVVVALVGALVVTMVPVVRDMSRTVAPARADASSAPPTPAGNPSAGNASEPRIAPAVAQPAATPSADAGVADAALARDGIAVDAVVGDAPSTGGTPGVGGSDGGNGITGDDSWVPNVPGAAELIAAFNGRQSVYLRVRWRPTQPSVPTSSYWVVCNRTSEPPQWVTAINTVLADIQGPNIFSDRLEASTSGTEVVFTNQLPVPGATYMCVVTPQRASGPGTPIVASGAVVPAGFSFPELPGPVIVSTEVVGTELRVYLADQEGNPLTAPISPVICTDAATGARVGGVQDETPYVPVAPVLSGHTYTCVAYTLIAAPSAPVTVTIAMASGSVPAAPTDLVADVYAHTAIISATLSGLTVGERYLIRFDCARGDDRVVGLGRFVASSAATSSYAGPVMDFPMGGRWDCSVVVHSAFGASPAASVPVWPGARLAEPTALALDRTAFDGAWLRFRAVPAWYQSPADRLVGYFCIGSDGSSLSAAVPIAQLEARGGGEFVVAVSAQRAVSYTCDLTLLLRYERLGGDYAIGWYSDPLTFTMPAGQARGEVAADPPVVSTTDTSPAPTHGAGPVSDPLVPTVPPMPPTAGPVVLPSEPLVAAPTPTSSEPQPMVDLPAPEPPAVDPAPVEGVPADTALVPAPAGA